MLHLIFLIHRIRQSITCLLYTSGELGDGTTEDRHTPVKIMDNVVSVSLGYEHSGAITKDGSLYMWGDNYYGELGDGTTENRYTPIKVMDLSLIHI